MWREAGKSGQSSPVTGHVGSRRQSSYAQALSHVLRAEHQDKRSSGPEHLHPLPPEVVTDLVLLVHLVSVHWEQSRVSIVGCSDQSRRAGGQGLGQGVTIVSEEEGSGRLREGCSKGSGTNWGHRAFAL